jgi:hypothetical protein
MELAIGLTICKSVNAGSIPAVASTFPKQISDLLSTWRALRAIRVVRVGTILGTPAVSCS